jgi:hypothetical protein
MDFRQMSALLSDKVKQQINQEHKNNNDDIDFLLDSEYIKELWNELTNEEEAVIQYFLLYKGTDLLTYRELEQEQFPIPRSSFRVGLTKLRRKGIVFTLRRLWGELAYVMPKELVSAFRKQQISHVDTWVDARAIPSASSYHINKHIFQVLNYVRTHPIELTKKGMIQKKDLRLLNDLFGIPKDHFTAFKRLETVLNPYENHEAIMLDILTSWNLLLTAENTLVIGDVDIWLRMSDEERQQGLLEIVQRYLDLDERLGFVYDVMCGLTGGRSYSLSKMTRSIGLIHPSNEDVKEKIFVPLSILGLINFVVLFDDVVWEWVGETHFEHCQLYVQPNFELLIPGFAPLPLKWEIAGFADLIFQEEMWCFSLNRDSIRRALKDGNNVDILISTLESYSAMPLPINVVQSMKQWQKDYQRIRFFDAKIMQISDPVLANELEKVEAISSLLLQRLGDCFFAVRPEAWEALVGELERRGYTSSFLEKMELKQNRKKESLKIFKQSDHKMEFKVESVFPDLDDAIPGMRQLPRIWTGNFQPYHASTLRELVQKALQMGVGLKLQWRGEIFEIIPSTLLNKDGYWTLQGKDATNKPSEYRLEDIQKIQVIISLI